jgi:hypothetical protein
VSTVSHSPTVLSTPLVTTSAKPTPFPTILVVEDNSRTLRPTPSSAPTGGHGTTAPSLAHISSKVSLAPTETEYFTSDSADGSINNITYFVYTVGFVVVAGGLCGYAFVCSKRTETNYTRVHMPKGNSLDDDDDESHGETEMSLISK